jgi:hypothetical protein
MTFEQIQIHASSPHLTQQIFRITQRAFVSLLLRYPAPSLKEYTRGISFIEYEDSAESRQVGTSKSQRIPTGFGKG